MSIASGATNGVEVETAAKESAGNAATLGSQTAAAANEVIVPDAITANNEGNLEATPSYVGRMIAIRPWEMKMTACELASGGSGYVVSEVVTLTGGVAGPNGAPQITVTSVDGGGAITGFTISREAGYDLRLRTMTGAPSPPESATLATTSSGSGTGATVDCSSSSDTSFAPHFEVRYITADSSNTLTVHDDWDVAPVSGDAWAVSYILEDCATVTGCTLRSQSGVFEFSRRWTIGDVTIGARRAFVSVTDGKQWEVDNQTNAMSMLENSAFFCGYLQAGAPVNGAYMSTSDSASSAWSRVWGALDRVYDLQIRSPRADINMPLNQTATSERRRRYSEIGSTWEKVKIFDLNGFQVNGSRIRDLVVQAKNSTADVNITWGIPATNGTSMADINGVLFVSSDYGFDLIGADYLDTGYLMRNAQFVDSNICRVPSVTNFIARIVNPTYVLDLSLRTPIGPGRMFFASNTQGSVREYMSLIINAVDAAGESISGVNGYIFEGGNSGGALPTDLSNQSQTGAVTDERFLDDVEGQIRYVTDVLTNIYEPTSSDTVAEDPRGTWAWRGYLYGREPAVVSLIKSLSGGLSIQTLFAIDSELTATTASAALTNPTTNPTVERHGTGETDTRPMKALNYDAGVGSVPTLGETVTQGSATGVVVAYEGTAVSGTLLVDTWNGTEFTDNQNITGGTSSFDATTNLAGGSGFYEEYHWEVDAKGEAMTVVYDYLAARMAEDTQISPFDDVVTWGGDESDASQLLFSGASGFFSNRAVQRWKGILQDGITADFSDNFNRADANLSASSNWDSEARLSGDMLVASNQLRAPTVSGSFEICTVATGAHTFVDAQYIKATLAVDVTGEIFGLCLRVGDGTLYAVTVSSASTYDLRHYTYTSNSLVAGGTKLASSTSAPTANDVITFVAVGQTLIVFINGTEEIRYVDDTESERAKATSGKAGVIGIGVPTGGPGRFDDLETGDFVDAVINGEGVFIHNRGLGDIAYFTSDSGTQFVPATTVTIETNGVTRGTSIVVQAKETAGTVTDGDILGSAFADVNGEYSFSLIYQAAWGAGLDVEVRARNQGIAVAALQDDGGVFTDYTDAANTGATAGDVFPLPAAAVANDAFYMGHSEPFAGMKIYLTTAFVGTYATTWEYWDGLAWSALTMTREDDWTTPTGDKVSQWSVPSDWAVTTVNSISNLYWVRNRASGFFSQTTQAVARKVTLDATRYLPDTQRRVITNAGLTTTMSWNEDTISEFP